GRVRSECQACAFHRRSSGSAAPLPAKAGTCPRAAGLAARASGSAGIPAARPPSSRPCRGYPCSFSLASARPEGSGVHTPAPSRRSLPSARFCVPPSALPRSALLSGLHPYPPAVAPVAWTSEALPFRDPQPFRSPLRSVLRRSRLLRPLLTSRSASASPFRAQGEISPGKNAVLHRTTAGFTPPEPRPSELRGSLPARPARRRLGSSSCTSARGFAPRFLPTVGRPSAAAVRFDWDGLLSAGLAPARQRPCWAHNAKAPRRYGRGLRWSRDVGRRSGVRLELVERTRIGNPRFDRAATEEVLRLVVHAVREDFSRAVRIGLALRVALHAQGIHDVDEVLVDRRRGDVARRAGALGGT